MFSQRARLYRFDQSAQQWKERGIGILKLLKHSKTGRIRVLMRRDQVLKVCANHYITSAMELRPNTGSDRSWVWCALDFSEEEAKDEQLAVKFKTPELAMNFKDVFEKCQKMISDLPAVKEEVIIENPSSSSDAKAVTQVFLPFAFIIN
uniref:E3 SUMO-protein ligase RanBP2-like n=1 Tax=Saccoglossus kowalevskii TaxID=10224 RepID=A0ABM0MD83_SACKO|nr:PREDICTED: E3 SUMO-protein ligase RanBP2-like [Saccoglossus kowalevskii]